MPGTPVESVRRASFRPIITETDDEKQETETVKHFCPLPLAAALALGLAGCQTVPATTISGWSMKRSLPANFKSYGYRIVSKADGHPVRAGETAVRFELRAGDCSWASSRNDCANDRERHEVMSADSWAGGENWYHWSIYLPADNPIIDPVSVVLGQFHQKGSHPVWMFGNRHGAYWARNHVSGTMTDATLILTREDIRGKWNDVLVHARWSARPNEGFFDVYVNGETNPRHSWTGSTKEPGRQIYFKFGIYRSFIS